MKLAEVLPLYKGKENAMLTNYRPVSLIVILSEVLEKKMSTRIYKHMEKCINSINANIGLEQKHNCEQTIMNLGGKIIHGMNKGQLTISLFLDLLKTC